MNKTVSKVAKIDSYAFAERLVKRGYKVIGSGCFSEVYATKKSKYVWKVSCKDKNKDAWYLYITTMLKEGVTSRHAPKVHEIVFFE